jgi:hypothetical protein
MVAAVSAMVQLRVLAAFGVMTAQVPQAALARLPGIYPGEYEQSAALTT